MTELRSRIGRSRWFGGILMCAALVAACGPGTTPSPIYVTASPTPSAVASGTASPTASPTPTPVITEGPTPSISSYTFNDPGSADYCGGWSATFEEPRVAGVDSAATMNAAIEDWVSVLIADFKSQLPTEVMPGPCYLNGDYTVAYKSPRLLSVRFSMDEYTGGASNFIAYGSLNFWIPSGATIDLAGIFTDPATALPILRTQAQAELTTKLGADLGWPSTPPDMDWFAKAWVFTEDGLSFQWDQCEVAACAENRPEKTSATIAWTALLSVLDPAGPAGEFIP
jgi:hypothetical protein